MAVLKKATIKSYDAATHKAAVQIAGSLAVWLDGVPVATDIPAADVVAGRQCAVLFLDPSNPDDAVVATIQGATPSGLGPGDLPDIHEDGSLVIANADPIDFIEPDATVVTNPVGSTARVDLSIYQREAEKSAANGYASLDATSLVPVAELPLEAKERAIAMGKAGVVAAAADTADFIQVAPFDMKLTRIKATCSKTPRSNATIQIRRSTDNGNSFSIAFGTIVITSAGTAKIFASNPADLDINEGDGFNFSVTGGADGEDYMLDIIGETR